ncbi:MAG: UDP-N-acetylmuramate dehydrogenase [Halanaerobiales bacterium]|nr:UDP-N-acetylmuramate dehydrogenase [Halanaerobiales bacterium]
MQYDSSLENKLNKIDNLEVRYNVPLKKYTSFRIGGPADIFLAPRTIPAFRKALSLLNNYQLPLFILGKGSNIIVGDKGFRGVVIYTGKLNRVEIKGKEIIAEAGITLSSLANKAMEAGLTGLEFASGIPGTLGGALYMNAGAYGGEMKDIITEAILLDYSGKEMKLKKKELGLSYRYSILQEKPLIAVKVKLKLKPGNREEIKAYMKEINQKRKEKQPLEWPSAGSAFKRPEGYYAGPLIEEAGMKGVRVGDAQVSEKHAGFIINLGNATARDVRQLMRMVQERVYEKSRVRLEPEPKFVGEF